MAMDILINVAVLLSAYGFMEWVAWFSHKYVMHGFLWSWHRDHHVNDRKTEQVSRGGFVWEKNDRFFLIYAIPGMVLMILGLVMHVAVMVSASVGITLYGFTYFVIHEIIYHQRLRVSLLSRNPSRYMQAVMRAHRAHHRPANKDDFHSYGLLVFPLKHFKQNSNA